MLSRVKLVLLLALSYSVLASEPNLALKPELAEADIRNLIQSDTNRYTSGQPDLDGMSALAKAGVKHVIDLRAPAEDRGFDESATVEQLGMRYHSLPVSGLAGLNENNARALHSLLEQVGEDAVVVHCGSGNRVGALMALRQAIVLGGSVEEAVKTGEDWGMTRVDIEAAVKLKLLSF